MATVVTPADEDNNFLTFGKAYAVNMEKDDCYLICDDDSELGWWNKSHFKVLEDTSATRDTQVGGNHYSKLSIQPYDYCTANKLGYIEGNVIKYVTRWRDKNGVEDLKKAVHSLQWLIEHEENKNV